MLNPQAARIGSAPFLIASAIRELVYMPAAVKVITTVANTLPRMAQKPNQNFWSPSMSHPQRDCDSTHLLADLVQLIREIPKISP